MCRERGSAATGYYAKHLQSPGKVIGNPGQRRSRRGISGASFARGSTIHRIYIYMLRRRERLDDQRLFVDLAHALQVNVPSAASYIAQTPAIRRTFRGISGYTLSTRGSLYVAILSRRSLRRVSSVRSARVETTIAPTCGDRVRISSAAGHSHPRLVPAVPTPPTAHLRPPCR